MSVHNEFVVYSSFFEFQTSRFETEPVNLTTGRTSIDLYVCRCPIGVWYASGGPSLTVCKRGFRSPDTNECEYGRRTPRFLQVRYCSFTNDLLAEIRCLYSTNFVRY